MEHIDVSNLSLAVMGAEIFRFVIRTTDLKDPVLLQLKKKTHGLVIQQLSKWWQRYVLLSLPPLTVYHFSSISGLHVDTIKKESSKIFTGEVQN